MTDLGTPWKYVKGRGIRTADDKFVGDAWPAYRKIIIQAVNEWARVEAAKK